MTTTSMAKVCSSCQQFFERFNRKQSRVLGCARNCDLKYSSCGSCRYRRCLAVGLVKFKKFKPNETEINSDLSIEVSSSAAAAATSSVSNSSLLTSVSSSSMSSSSSSCASSPSTLTNSSSPNNLIANIFNEIEHKKQLIRSAHSEPMIGNYFAELSATVAEFLTKSSSTHGLFCFNQTSLNRQLLVAYICLVDNDSLVSSHGSYLQFFLGNNSLNRYDLRLKQMLSNIYAPIAATDNSFYNPTFVNDSSQTFEHGQIESNQYNSFHSSQNYSNYHVSYNNNQVKSVAATSTRLDELKMLHFLLLLFTSFLSFEEFIQMDCGMTSTHANKKREDVGYCQKLLVKLIDRLCDNKTVKANILLSLSEFELF